nr:MAG TPA: restriction alleviation protein [Caudoviricetes sp.]
MDKTKLKPYPFCGGKSVEILEDENKFPPPMWSRCGMDGGYGRKMTGTALQQFSVQFAVRNSTLKLMKILSC